MSSIYPDLTPDIRRKRRDLAPDQQAAFDAFDKAVFADGALPAKVKQIIAVAVAHVTQSPYASKVTPRLLSARAPHRQS